MKAATALVVTLAALLFALPSFAADTAADKPAAEKPAKKPAAHRYFPTKPFDLTRMYFELKDERAKKMEDLQKKYVQDRQELIEILDQKLDEEYAKSLSELMTDEERAKFAKVLEAVGVYQTAMKSAQREYRESWTVAAGEEPRWLPQNANQIATMIPALTPAEREKLVRNNIWKRQQDEIKKALADEGVTQPADRKDAEAWKKYYGRYRELQVEISERLAGEVLKEQRAALTPEHAELFDKLLAAHEAYDGKKSAAEDSLHGQLLKLVDPAKLEGPAGGSLRGMQFGGPAGAAGVVVGGNGLTKVLTNVRDR